MTTSTMPARTSPPPRAKSQRSVGTAEDRRRALLSTETSRASRALTGVDCSAGVADSDMSQPPDGGRALTDAVRRSGAVQQRWQPGEDGDTSKGGDRQQHEPPAPDASRSF